MFKVGQNRKQFHCEMCGLNGLSVCVVFFWWFLIPLKNHSMNENPMNEGAFMQHIYIYIHISRRKATKLRKKSAGRERERSQIGPSIHCHSRAVCSSTIITLCVFSFCMFARVSFSLLLLSIVIIIISIELSPSLLFIYFVSE